MQSEESNTLVKLAKAVIEHAPEGGDAFWGIKFSDIEAALSAADPVGYLVSRGDVAGPDNEYYSFCEDQGSAAAEADIYDKGYFPIYAAPPAPSVAVKALDRLPTGHVILEQADTMDGRVSQTVRDKDGHEYERIVSAVEAYGEEE